ncbi:MAG: hypothetical protein AB1641_23815 [Thermodesulfobacteriota bacterium]
MSASGDYQEKNTDPGPWPDDLPPCLIHVDKDGRLWHLGAEMINLGINRLLLEHVDLDEKGRYVIDYQGQRCFIEVEDTLFVVARVDALGEEDGASPWLITLNDGTTEQLDPTTLTQSPDNVLYARVKNGRFPARFLRPSYYQLAERVKEKDGHLVLTVAGRDYPVA